MVYYGTYAREYEKSSLIKMAIFRFFGRYLWNGIDLFSGH